MAWQTNLLTSPADLDQLLTTLRTVALLGIKTEAQAEQPAFYVPAYLRDAGWEIVPVPVYYPEATHILGRPVYRCLTDIPVPVDVVNVFRRPADVPGHLDDLLSKHPRAVWLQTGIRHEAAAETLARAGILVVQDRCLMVEHRRWAAAAVAKG